MPSSEDSRSRSAHVMAPHRWRSARILEAVCQVNEHLVSALTELARNGNASTVVVAQNADVFRHLDAVAIKRVARIPVLLLDLHFQSETWWRNATSLKGGACLTTAGASGLPVDLAAELIRETLIVGWLAVRETRQSANLLFGMSNVVADLLGELLPQQLDRVAARTSHDLRVRWQSKPDFWRQLLVAAHGGNAEDLCHIHLQGLQLLGGELMNTRT